MNNEWLNTAESAIGEGDNLAAIAASTTGILALVIEQAAREDREDFLRGKWDAADNALASVLALADELDSHPHATLKPTAFRDLAARIRAAVDGE